MKKVTKALREEADELIRCGNSKEQCEGLGMVKVLNEIDKLTREQLEEQFVETSSPGWEFDKTKPIEYMCNLCGGMFPKKEMDFDVKSEEDFTDVCKNCNYTSYNDSPYGDNPLDNHINTMASMIKNLTNPKTK